MKDRLVVILRRTAFATVALFVGCAVFAASSLYAQVTDTTDVAGTSDVVQVLEEEEGEYSQLADALQRTGLDQTLGQQQSFTLFAPNDSAFQQMETPAGEMGEQELADVLRYHIIPEEVTSEQLGQMTEVTMGTGETVEVAQQDGQMTISGATITSPDIRAENGVIHGIDQVLQPMPMGAE